MEAFNNKCEITTYGDFMPMEEVQDPAFLIHVVKKL
jgi:hypothetical protein